MYNWNIKVNRIHHLWSCLIYERANEWFWRDTSKYGVTTKNLRILKQGRWFWSDKHTYKTREEFRRKNNTTHFYTQDSIQSRHTTAHAACMIVDWTSINSEDFFFHICLFYIEVTAYIHIYAIVRLNTTGSWVSRESVIVSWFRKGIFAYRPLAFYFTFSCFTTRKNNTRSKLLLTTLSKYTDQIL